MESHQNMIVLRQGSTLQANYIHTKRNTTVIIEKIIERGRERESQREREREKGGKERKKE